MNGLWPCLGVDEDYVDALVAQPQLQLRRETACDRGAVRQGLIDFHEEINIAASGLVVDARPEQSRPRRAA